MTIAIAITIGFLAAGLVLLGPRISDGIRARKQQAAEDARKADDWIARMRAAEIAARTEAADPTSPARLRPIPTQRKEQP